MTAEIILRLTNLGIDPNQTSIEIFDNLLDLCEFLWEESEITEIQRFERELNRIIKPTN
jgi:hypothetical protein